ncbi:MAG: retropepsin-like aspartic protease [Bacteroidota bacterium]
MKFGLLLLLCLFLAFTGLAQESILNIGTPKSVNYFEELPYETINGKMFIYVELAGQKHKFLFDTGAPVAISKELANELELSIIDRIYVQDVNNRGDSSNVFSIDEIKLGNVAFNDIPAIDIFPEIYKCWGIDGVIGSNILRYSIVRINPDKHTITITDQTEKLTLNEANSTAMLTDNNDQSTPFIQVRLKNKLTLNLPFDTGDNGFLRLSEDLMTEIADSNVYKTIDSGYGASTEGAEGLQPNAEKYLLKFPLLSVAMARFTNVFTETNKNGIPGIGARLLDYGTVTMDFINGKFYFDAKAESNDMDEKRWPFEPVFKDEKLIVGLVWKEANKEVKPGQQIISIDNKDCTKISICDLLNNGPVLAGKEQATLVIKNKKGEEKKIRITKQ